MKEVEKRELNARFRAQLALVTRQELRRLGVTREAERRRLANGEWRLLKPWRVIAVAAAPETPEQLLLAACLAGGPAAIASHESAAWLWDLGPIPDQPVITVPRGAFRSQAVRTVNVHRPIDYPAHVVTLRRVPVTNPLRTLVDLAAVAAPNQLDDAVDRALAKRLLTVPAIEAELDRVGRRGRRGAGVMRAALDRRGFAGAPSPSVLESRLLRLLRQGGIEPIGTEVWLAPDNRYRVDTMLSAEVVLEVDGYSYHETPEQFSEDKRRRQRLRMSGLVVLEYTWADVILDGRRILTEARAALR